MKSLGNLWGNSLSNYALAMDSATPPDVLDSISHEADPMVRCEVAQNPSTLPETLANLSADNYWVVRFNVVMHPNTPYGIWISRYGRVLP